MPDYREPGFKDVEGKARVHAGVFQQFPRALLAIALASELGAVKYRWGGWRTVPDGVEKYKEALCRHILNEEIEGEKDLESGRLHAEHIAWNALAVLELTLIEKEKQDEIGR